MPAEHAFARRLSTGFESWGFSEWQLLLTFGLIMFTIAACTVIACRSPALPRREYDSAFSITAID